MIRVRRYLERARCFPANAGFAHKSRSAPARNEIADFAEIVHDRSTTIAKATAPVKSDDFEAQFAIPLLARALRTFAPRVITGARHREDATPRRHLPATDMRLDKRVSQRDSLAKKAVVDSSGQRNTKPMMIIGGVANGSNRASASCRKRSRLALTLAAREEISRGIAAGCSIRTIASQLKRPPSTVSREIQRNGGEAHYRSGKAEERAWERSRRPKKCRLAINGKLRQMVASKLKMQWSPQQISGWLKTRFPEQADLQVSHEAIYQALFVQARGALKKELQYHLRTGRVMRHARTATRKRQTRYQIVDAVSIRERPAEIEDRSVTGHWEGDLLCGSGNTPIATLVERQSRFTSLVKLRRNRKDAQTVAAALSRKSRTLPAELRRSVTLDRGPEFAAHKKFTVARDVAVYFCDPKSPWQRGTNENTNRLLRQYLPDGTNPA